MARHAKVPAPRSHWLLLSAVLASVTMLLLLHAATLCQFDDAADPSQVHEGGPVLDTARQPPMPPRPMDRTLALTFDGGPDPVWTPAILDTLAEFGVHATFFVSGAHAARYPGLVAEIVARGHEIGGYAGLRDAGDLRTQLELRGTDLALAGAAGIGTALVRSPNPTTLGGRLAVLSDVDSQDERNPGVAAIVANSIPQRSHGTIVRMHDAGGDRAQTVAALRQLIPALWLSGWRLGTVSGSLGIAPPHADPGAAAEFGGWLLIAAVQAGDLLADGLSVLLVVTAVLAALRTLMVLATTRVHLRHVRDRGTRHVGEPVTVIIPAYNEEAGISDTIRSALASDHPVRVVVVDDGSTDRTAEIVEGLDMSRIRLIRQANAGKPAALNAGIAAARTELIVTVDGDTVLAPGAVRAMAGHFADPEVGAVSGNAKVGNRHGFLGRWQHIEYVVGFNLDRRMYDVLECMPTVPGAAGAFRRSALRRLGGVPADTLAEDTDLTMALERQGWRVVYEPRAQALTEVPSTVTQLWKQRYRWCYGTLQAVWKHRAALTERGAAGRLGRCGIPCLILFQLLLPILAPLVDVALVFGVVSGDWVSPLGFWLAFLALQAIPGILAFRLDREPLGTLLFLPLQQFAYRQLMYLVVVQAVMTAVAGARLPWHKLERTGLAILPPRR